MKGRGEKCYCCSAALLDKFQSICYIKINGTKEGVVGNGDLMPPPEPQKIRLFCNVCGQESQHFRDLFKHWTEAHSKEYEERRQQECRKLQSRKSEDH